ncbi:cyclic nucleotide-binding domain-containing protein [Candidatus Neomarinimicrobiota bacterium]
MSAISAKHLENFELLSNLTGEERASFSSKIKEKHYSAGKVVFTEGDEGGVIFFLLSGEVEITQSLTLSMSKSVEHDSRDKSIIRLSGEQHAIIGEVSLVGGEEKRTATVTALTNCRMGLMTAKDFYTILDANPEIGYKVMRNLGRIITGRLLTANKNVLKLTTALSLILEK